MFHLSFCFGFVDAPRIVQNFFTLPLNLICRGSQPLKQASHKVNFYPLTLYSLCPLNPLEFVSKFLFFTKWEPFKNYEKCFFFHLESSFRSRDIQIFVFSASPLSLPVSYCFRGWIKRNLKVYNVINCLNENLITHFVW